MISRTGLVGMASISLMLLDLVGGAVGGSASLDSASRDRLAFAI
jgi:hypothetical protein